jgi:CRISPR-associated protein Csd1
MILQALHELYARKAARGEIAPEGFTQKPVDYLIVLDIDGRFIRLKPLQELRGKKRIRHAFYLPRIGKQAEKHSMAGDDANLLWDKAEFVLGIGNKGDRKLSSFIDTIQSYYPSPPDDVASVLRFLLTERALKTPFNRILMDEDFGEEIGKGAAIITFIIDGELLPITSQSHVSSAMTRSIVAAANTGTCLISGATDAAIEVTLPAIKKVDGAQSSGAYLVSFNQPSFSSYGKAQSANAPISKLAAVQFSQALQSLLDSAENRVRLADATIVFWAQRRERTFDLESHFSWFVAMSPKDDPDRGVRAAKALFEAAATGGLGGSDDHFYVLALSPNAARISVRFWKTGPIREFGAHIIRHFEDYKIAHGSNESEHLSLFQILTATVLQGKMDNVPPNLAGAVITSILDGALYPNTLLQLCMRRIRAERKVTRARAAIIKAYFNRFNRIHHPSQKEISMSLDPDNNEPGYRIGRLFAVLEKIQEEAQGNATIRERYYGAASTSPITVFSQLLKLKNHHLAKLVDKKRNWFERMIGEIMCPIISFPAHLTLNEQALFAIGYYHQRQDFYTGKKQLNTIESTNSEQEHDND